MTRFWFYRPELYWYGWRTLLPFFLGNDENERRVFMLGWTITGRLCVAWEE